MTDFHVLNRSGTDILDVWLVATFPEGKRTLHFDRRIEASHDGRVRIGHFADDAPRSDFQLLLRLAGNDLYAMDPGLPPTGVDWAFYIEFDPNIGGDFDPSKSPLRMSANPADFDRVPTHWGWFQLRGRGPGGSGG